MAIERFLPVDLFMDFCILTAVQLALNHFRLRRILSALAWMLGWTLFSYLGNVQPTILAALQLPVCLIAARILNGRQRVFMAALGILAGSFAGAGFASAVNRLPALHIPAAVAGVAIVYFLLRRHGHLRFRWNIQVYAEICGAHAEFPALIDTGNHLHEARSRLPVLIAEADCILDLAEAAWMHRPEEMRHVHYGALGGSGKCPCFHPDRILMRTQHGDFRAAPDCWIAIYPGTIPGRICALAPPEFADAADS